MQDVAAETQVERRRSGGEPEDALMFEAQSRCELGVAFSRQLQMRVDDVDAEHRRLREEVRDARGDLSRTAPGVQDRCTWGKRVACDERFLLRPNRSRLRVEVPHHRLVGHLLRLRIQVHDGL